MRPASVEACASAPRTAPAARTAGGERAPSALRLVDHLVHEAHGTGIDTSAGQLFNHSVWARDRIISAFDLLPERPDVARQTILTLARLQGTRRTVRSEEEPGRIHNELRDLRRWRAPWRLKAPFGLVLAELWGGSPRGYITYFGSDSTPLFVSLVATYAKLRPAILDELVVRRDGSAASIGDAVREAARWIESHLTADGLVEVPKHNVFSLPPQIWRDSPTSNFDERGRMANVVAPMAYLDVQALCADALEDAAALVRDGGRRLPPGPDTERGARDTGWQDALVAEARRIREATQRSFWMEDEAYYAFAADRDAGGGRRVLRAVQSNAGWLLATRFLDAMPAADMERFVGGVVRTLFSPDLLTPAGIRGRALRHRDPAFRNYHEDVWPMDTAMIARGLRRHGFHELADELEARLVNAATLLGDAWEFIVVDDAGRIVDPRTSATQARADEAGPRSRACPLPAEMLPEADIGWTATALLRIKRDRTARFCADEGGNPAAAQAPDASTTPAEPADRAPWITELTAEILGGIGTTVVARSLRDLTAAPLLMSPSYLDHAAGLRRSARIVLAQGFGRVLPLGLYRRAHAAARRTGRERA